MGLRDDGDAPVTRAHTGGSCARVQGAGPDVVALVVPSGAGIEAQFARVGMRQSYVALPSAHRKLATGLADPKRGLPMVRELFENGRELYRLYEELNKDNKKKEAAGATS